MSPFDLGPGLALRLFEERSAEELFSVIDRNREHLHSWLPWVDRSVSAKQTREFILTTVNQYGIFENDTLIGAIGLHKIYALNRNTSIGYWLDCAAQGRGIMTRACRAMVTHAFQEFALHRVEIRCGTGNIRSCAVPQRLGFVREGVLRQAEWVNDRYLDLVVWSMLAPDWTP